jgi:hypothetical protein
VATTPELAGVPGKLSAIVVVEPVSEAVVV